jgi:hypothetical protein
MRALSWNVRSLLLVTVTSLFAAAPVVAQTTKRDPAGTGPIMTQLRGLFFSWDLDKDGYLDKNEMAKAFRGPSAKAYDYQAASKGESDVDKKDLSVTGTRTVGLMGSTQGCGPLLSASSLLAPKPDKGESSQSDAKKTAKQPDYSSYPDYQFLTQLDTNGDGQVSKSEFDNWARGYAVQVKHLNDAAKRIARLETRLNSKLKTTERQKVETELKQEQDELKKLNDLQKSFEKQLARSSGIGKK